MKKLKKPNRKQREDRLEQQAPKRARKKKRNWGRLIAFTLVIAVLLGAGAKFARADDERTGHLKTENGEIVRSGSGGFVRAGDYNNPSIGVIMLEATPVMLGLFAAHYGARMAEFDRKDQEAAAKDQEISEIEQFRDEQSRIPTEQ